ncbi:MAG: ATP-dependent Clp protease adapter ClpS [Desulfobulbaceae bacterium]|nr:ATP-dependent Clp protease adapter ClpS [Desulfobulbaceae bacterium]
MAGNASSPLGETGTISRQELQEPPLYRVLLHNDDYTTMEFVIMILERVFDKNNEEATRIMLNVHHEGVGLAGLYTREIAETKVVTVHRLAKKNQFPLRCSLERDT